MLRSPITTTIALALCCLLSLTAITSDSHAASAVEIDAKVNATIERFYREVGAGKELADKANGMLVFPSIVKAGLVLGGEYGEGSLRIDDRTVGYYATASGSLGLQIGVQAKSMILLFMNKSALDNFRNSKGWEVGVDGSVAVVEMGTGGSLDTTNAKQPIIGFIFGQKGLMGNLTLEGTKMTKINR